MRLPRTYRIFAARRSHRSFFAAALAAFGGLVALSTLGIVGPSCTPTPVMGAGGAGDCLGDPFICKPTETCWPNDAVTSFVCISTPMGKKDGDPCDFIGGQVVCSPGDVCIVQGTNKGLHALLRRHPYVPFARRLPVVRDWRADGSELHRPRVRRGHHREDGGHVLERVGIIERDRIIERGGGLTPSPASSARFPSPLAYRPSAIRRWRASEAPTRTWIGWRSCASICAKGRRRVVEREGRLLRSVLAHVSCRRVTEPALLRRTGLGPDDAGEILLRRLLRMLRRSAPHSLFGRAKLLSFGRHAAKSCMRWATFAQATLSSRSCRSSASCSSAM